MKRWDVTFIEPNMWPPNSPDLNPVDDAVWSALQHAGLSTSTIHDNRPAEEGDRH